VYDYTNATSGYLTNAVNTGHHQDSDGTVLRDTGWLTNALIRNGIINTNDLTTLQNDKYVLELLCVMTFPRPVKDVPFILEQQYEDRSIYI